MMETVQKVTSAITGADRMKELLPMDLSLAIKNTP
jgi:hypothetical protein